MKQFTYLIVVLFLCSYSFDLNAQGCSDAGLCSVEGIKPDVDDSDEDRKSHVKIGVSYGKADHEITTTGGFLEYKKQFTQRFALDLKLTALGQSGNDISVFDVSDVYLNSIIHLSGNTAATIGVKFPLSKADAKENDKPLPMDYQASLGTTDLLVGLSTKIREIGVTLGFQQPLKQNDNTFFADSSAFPGFQSTNKFIRSSDFLFRLHYSFKTGGFSFTPAILGIYHIDNDRYTNKSNTEIDIDGSSGITLNLNAFVKYAFTTSHAVELQLGAPVVVRDTRPDGLTRSVVAGLSYAYAF